MTEERGSDPRSRGLGSPGLFPKPVEEMEECKDRMLMDHAGSGILHDDPDFFPHIGPVTVNRAPGAGRLVFLERAKIESLVRILQEGRALTAQPPAGHAVVPAAVDADHGGDGSTLPFHSALLFSAA
jgi:hypothetical protein